MANDYQGSFAQNNIIYSTAYTYTVTPGDNFVTPMVFVGSSDAAANFVTPPGIAAYTFVNSSNYASLTKSTLLTWLTAFYANNQISRVCLVEFDDTGFPGSSTLLTTVFNSVKALGYFKFLLSTTATEQVAFAGVCATDTVTTQCCIATADVECYNGSSTTGIWDLLDAANYDCILDFNVTAANSLMTQLGVSLGVLNASGWSIGNALDCKSVSSISPSGTAGAVLTAAQITVLQNRNIGYWWYVGNSTGYVTAYRPKTIAGVVYGSTWFANFVDFVSSVIAATMLTNPGDNFYTNNTTYQMLLGIINGQIAPFTEGSGTGLISNFKLTKAPFNKTIMVSAGKITIPNAWSGSYNDNTRSVLVQGNLTVSL